MGELFHEGFSVVVLMLLLFFKLLPNDVNINIEDKLESVDAVRVSEYSGHDLTRLQRVALL